MKFSAINTTTETDQMVLQIENLILTGKLKIGEKLPSERDLSQQLKVSRSVVNHGLTKLSQLGFIEIKPRVGNFIADYNRNGNLETLNVIINFKGGNYHPSLLKSIFQVRRLFEEAIIDQCDDGSDFTEVKRIFSQIQNVDTPIEKATKTFDFYYELALASNNSVFPLLILHFKSIYITLGTWLVQDGKGPELEKYLQMIVKDLSSNNLNKAISDNDQTIDYCLYELLK